MLPKASDLAPCILVASPSLARSFFGGAVVLLVDHREDGAFGLVLNRPAEVQLGDVFEEVGIEPSAAPGTDALVLKGGPVSPGTGWIVFDPSGGVWPTTETVQLCPRLAVSASFELLEAVAAGRGPERRVMMLGYAGWGPGQLDEEMKDGSWIPVDVDPDLVFEVPVDDRWARAFETFGIDPTWVGGLRVAEA